MIVLCATHSACSALLLGTVMLAAACGTPGGAADDMETAGTPMPSSTADTLIAYEDFSNIEVEGFAPYYRDQRWEALAVHSVEWGDRFAAAETIWEGPEGLYDLLLVTITEQDGESTYRVSVGGEASLEVRNPPGPDYELGEHRWRGVELRPGVVLQVSSNSDSNGTVPEGDGFATSRGRWRYLIIEPSVR